MRFVTLVVIFVLFVSVKALASEEVPSPTQKERTEQWAKVDRCLTTRKCRNMPRYLTIRKFDNRHRLVLTHVKKMGVVVQFRIEL